MWLSIDGGWLSIDHCLVVQDQFVEYTVQRSSGFCCCLADCPAPHAFPRRSPSPSTEHAVSGQVQTGMHALWSVLFITLLLSLLYLFTLGITMLISNPGACTDSSGDRDGRVLLLLIITLAFVLEIIPISLCCCLRTAKPVQNHFCPKTTRPNTRSHPSESEGLVAGSPPSPEDPTPDEPTGAVSSQVWILWWFLPSLWLWS